MAGGLAGAGPFFHYFIATSLLSMAYHALGLWLGCLFPTVSSALYGGYFCQGILFLFGSMLIPGPAIPRNWWWLWYLNPLRYAAEGVWTEQFYCSPADNSAGLCPTFDIGPEVPLYGIIKWVFISTRYGLTQTDPWADLGYVMCFWVFYTAAAAVSSRLVSHVKR